MDFLELYIRTEIGTRSSNKKGFLDVDLFRRARAVDHVLIRTPFLYMHVRAPSNTQRLTGTTLMAAAADCRIGWVLVCFTTSSRAR